MSRYIDADALIAAIPDEPYKGAVRRLLMQAPTADVAPVVHSKWIWDSGSRYECEACGNTTEVDEITGTPIYNYCPNCGAKMDGKKALA